MRTFPYFQLFYAPELIEIIVKEFKAWLTCEPSHVTNKEKKKCTLEKLERLEHFSVQQY